MEDEKTLIEIREIVTQIALEIFEDKKLELLQKQRDSNIQYVKNILKKYKMMKHYFDEMGIERHTDENSFLQGGHNQIIPIIKRFNQALKIFGFICINSNKEEDIRCFRIIEEIYIKNETDSKENHLRGEDKFSLLAEKYHINKRTIYRRKK